MKINDYNDWSETRFEIEFGIVPESRLLFKFLIWIERYAKWIIKNKKIIHDNKLKK